MEQKERRFEITRAEFTLTQQQVDKYDNLLSTTKTWATTLDRDGRMGVPNTAQRGFPH